MILQMTQEILLYRTPFPFFQNDLFPIWAGNVLHKKLSAFFFIFICIICKISKLTKIKIK